ncbi:TPA: MarR family transcriptional regulator, partial [Pasteurella multocida]|nr:MarR family transcriptional regulator [Pasteurella multocida]HDR0734935.1 MarR family transcriptional regulator [Pasteurella multocida]
DTGENYAKSIIAPLLEIENNTAQSFGIERLEKLIDEFAILERLFNEQMNTFINRINQ